MSHLNDTDRRAYVIADNKLALNAGWDHEMLAIELQGLVDLKFEVELTGFSLAEIDLVLDDARDSAVEGSDTAVEDIIPPYQHNGPTVTRPGDLWVLGRHRLVCGDAREPNAYALLLDSEVVDLVFCDPPYNVEIHGNVGGLGRVRHRNFAMGVGEMNRNQFTSFLTETLQLAANTCKDGAIAFVCMDWRHMGELLEAGAKAFFELKNVCFWNKTNGGMGTFYRSKHEMVFVFKVGTAPHVNTFGLGNTGRYRSNVWDYAGVNTFRSGRLQELELHPTVKPTDLVADAIKDCSRRGDIVLDPFGGSGTTLIAAQKAGRRARLIEFDPAYCDVIIRRFQAVTGTAGVLQSTAQSFEDVFAARMQSELSDGGPIRPLPIPSVPLRRSKALKANTN